MPIVHFTNSKTQTGGGLKNVLNYVSKTEKTQSEDKKYVTTLNCSAPTVYEEFMATKNLYHKNSGRMYYHLVQSFPKGYDISPELAHKIAVEFSEKSFGNFECIVATHIDREHIHSHIVFNSVSFTDGKKYRSNAESVKKLMALSDEICLKYGVPILEKPVFKKDNDTISDREYRSAVKGESYKLALMYVIDEMMKKAKSKQHFIRLMNQNGYLVRWEDNRKYITYTCPNGQKCRCKRLHEHKYTKEMMTLEFEIRLRLLEEIKQWGAERRNGQDTRTAVSALHNSASDFNSDRGGDIERLDARLSERISFGTGKTDETLGRNENGTTESDGRTYETGWEDERAILLADEENRVLQNTDKGQIAEIYSNIAVSTARLIGNISAATEVDSKKDYELKRKPKAHNRKRKRRYVLKPYSNNEDMNLKM